MNTKASLDKAKRIGSVWHELTTLRRRVARINSHARQLHAQGQLAVADVADKLADAGGRCPCGKDFGPRFGDRWTICFRVPLSRGGDCTVANAEIVCRTCEIRRAATLGIKWEGSGRAHADRSKPRKSVRPRPVESPGTPPLAFRDDEDEKS